MVFHGDYEIEFEIYEKVDGGTDRSKLLGYHPGADPQDAAIRWAESHNVENDKWEKIYALFPVEEWK